MPDADDDRSTFPFLRIDCDGDEWAMNANLIKSHV